MRRVAAGNHFSTPVRLISRRCGLGLTGYWYAVLAHDAACYAYPIECYDVSCRGGDFG